MNVGINERAQHMCRRGVSVPLRRPEFCCTRWRVGTWPVPSDRRVIEYGHVLGNGQTLGDSTWKSGVLQSHSMCLPFGFSECVSLHAESVSPARGSPNSQEGLETLNIKHNIDFSLWKILKVLMPLYMIYFIIWKFLKVANTFIKGLKEQIMKGKRQAGLLWSPLFFVWNQKEKEGKG